MFRGPMDMTDVTVKGTVLKKPYLNYLDKFYEFPVRDGDVWICGIPKSGTTWAQEMVWMIMNNLDTEGAKADIHSRVPFVEKTWLTPVNEELPEYVRDSMGFIKKEYEKGPVCLKTHLPWVLLPRDIQENLRKPKIVYVLRDPKDAMLSLYHFIKILTGYKETMEEFCEGYMQNKRGGVDVRKELDLVACIKEQYFGYSWFFD